MRNKLILIFLTIIVFLLTMLCAHAQLSFHIVGVNNTLLTNINKRLDLFNQSIDDSLSSSSINEIAKQGVTEIRSALEPFGYFKSKIIWSQSHHQDKWSISYAIEPGIAVRLNKIDIRLFGPGKSNEKLALFINNFPLKSGQVFDANAYNHAKEELFTLLNVNGYIKNTIRQNKIYIDIKRNQANIILYIETGDEYKFGPVTFTSKGYSPQFLKRFINFTSEDHFSSKRLNKLQLALTESPYFQDVLITPDLDHIDNYQVPVLFSLTPPKSQRYNLGLGYGSLSGPRLIAGMNFRRLNGWGHHFDAQIKLSAISSGIAGKYYIPGTNPLTDQWIFGANYQRFSPKNGLSRSTTLSAGYMKKLSKWQFSTDLNYLTESFQVDGRHRDFSHLLYPNLNISYVKSNDLLNPSSGISFNIFLRGASDSLLSSTNFLQSEITTKYLFSPTESTHVILKLDLGYTTVSKIQNLPLSMRFFAGGLNSIRGYTDQSIGPGKYLSTGSIELQQRVYGNWMGAVFYDLGTAADRWGTKLSRSEGVGIIYQSPIGPIKGYVAKALKGQKSTYSLEFSIGPEFNA